MRWIKIDEEQMNVPVFKNIWYALKLVWNTDKNLLLGYFLQEIFGYIFALFIRNILFLKILLEVINGNNDFGVYVKYLLMFFAVSAVTKVLQWKGEQMEKYATKNVLKLLNNMIFEKANSLDVACYENPEFYDKYKRATLVLENSFFDFICSAAASIAASLISFICVVTTVSFINPVYLLFLLPVLFVFAIEMAKSRQVYKRDLKMTTNDRLKAYVQRTVFLRDYSKDMRTSNIFAVLMDRFEKAINANIKILREYGVVLFVYSMVSSFFSDFIPIVGTYVYAGYEFVIKNTMTISGFSVVLSSITSVRVATMDIANYFDRMTQMALYFQNLRDFFEYKPTIVSGTKKAEKFESIEFKNVSFKYPSADKNSLNNLSFKITKGETVAVVGVNGAGKSTLVKLLLRFHDASEGEVLYNGVNVKEYDVESLRNAYATVFQDYKNFAVSIYENVMCRECNDEDKLIAQKALEQSGVWKKVCTLPNGGNTVLTREFDENGAGLSGGENQKVSTARMFAKNFDIAILDEPSSALDPVAEYKMYENLIKFTENKTVIYISHRLSSAVLSDRIIVLSAGTVSETGTHSQLMSQGGEYARMFALQASSYKGEEAEQYV